MTCGKPCDLAVAYRVQQIAASPPTAFWAYHDEQLALKLPAYKDPF